MPLLPCITSVSCELSEYGLSNFHDKWKIEAITIYCSNKFIAITNNLTGLFLDRASHPCGWVGGSVLHNLHPETRADRASSTCPTTNCRAGRRGHGKSGRASPRFCSYFTGQRELRTSNLKGKETGDPTVSLNWDITHQRSGELSCPGSRRHLWHWPWLTRAPEGYSETEVSTLKGVSINSAKWTAPLSRASCSTVSHGFPLAAHHVVVSFPLKFTFCWKCFPYWANTFSRFIINELFHPLMSHFLQPLVEVMWK